MVELPYFLIIFELNNVRVILFDFSLPYLPLQILDAVNRVLLSQPFFHQPQKRRVFRLIVLNSIKWQRLYALVLKGVHAMLIKLLPFFLFVVKSILDFFPDVRFIFPSVEFVDNFGF